MREITMEQAGRFGVVAGDAALAGKDALARWGGSKQWDMAIEEMGELLTAMARKGRGRASDADVIRECADVIITSIQVALLHGGGDLNWLIDAIAEKTTRLRERISTSRSPSPLAQKEAAGG